MQHIHFSYIIIKCLEFRLWGYGFEPWIVVHTNNGYRFYSHDNSIEEWNCTTQGSSDLHSWHECYVINVATWSLTRGHHLLQWQCSTLERLEGVGMSGDEPRVITPPVKEWVGNSLNMKVEDTHAHTMIKNCRVKYQDTLGSSHIYYMPLKPKTPYPKP